MASPAKRFRHSASFGRRIEYWIIGRMLKEGLDVYVPLVDDNAIDAVVRRPDGSFVEVQIKARSADVADRDAGLFAAITHELRTNYWFVFYSERLDTTWIMTSQEFIDHSLQNKNGMNKGLRSIWFNGCKQGKEYVKPQIMRFVATDFKRIVQTI